MTEISIKDIIEHNFYIVNKFNNKVPFKLNSAQCNYYNNMTRRDIILKSRKQGFSSEVGGIFLARGLTMENRKAVVISHEKKSTQRLLSRVKYYLKHMEFPPKVETESVEELYFPDTNSRFIVLTAGSRAFGRGDDITDLHVSEIDFWQYPDRLTGVMEALTNDSWMVVESTANGWGSYLHNMWKKAKKKESEFCPHFYGWNYDDTCVLKDYPIENLTDIEKELTEKYKLSMEQIAWRRWKIKDMTNPELFPQEYPISEEEAFIATGRPVFAHSILTMWYDKDYKYEVGDIKKTEKGEYKFEKNKSGAVKIFRHPKKDMLYFSGADLAEGAENALGKSDFNAISVIDDDWKQVATIHNKLAVHEISDLLFLIGMYYNAAKISIEKNSAGYAALQILAKDLFYPNIYYEEVEDEISKTITKKYGWHTNRKTRDMLIDTIRWAITNSETTIRDREWLDECMSFVVSKTGVKEASAGSNDDCVFSHAIAIITAKKYPKLEQDPRFVDIRYDTITGEPIIGNTTNFDILRKFRLIKR